MFNLSVEKPQSWKWTQKSVRHQEKFERLREVAQVSPHKIKEINGVRVCFEEEFRIGRGIAATKVYVGLAKDGYEKAVKRLPRDIVDFAEQEKKILNQANVIESKHVVNYWFLDDESDPDWVFLIMDLCEETLQDYVDASHHILWEEWSEKVLKHPYLLPKEEQFELLQKIGNQREVKTGDKKSDVVTELNSNPTDWQRLMGPDILNYLSTVNVGGGSRIRQYGSSLTECLRLIRNVSLHWNDQPHPFPQPEAFYNVGDPKEYFLKTFPGLAVEVHRIVRSSEWKERPELKNCFT